MWACDKADANVEPQPLWEYPAKAAADPVKLLDFDFSAEVRTFENLLQEKSLTVTLFTVTQYRAI